MKQLKVMGSVLLVLVMSIILLGSALALTSTEKENQYNTALEELESYLESPEESRDGVTRLNAIMADLEELGNYNFSKELSYYAFVLLKIEENDFSDWHTEMYLESLCLNEKFVKYTKDECASAIAAPEELQNYYNGRMAESQGDDEAAIACYAKCISFFDAMERRMRMTESLYASVYQKATELMNAGKLEEAYTYFVQCRSYTDAEISINYIIRKLGYDPGRCGNAHTWVEATYEAPKTCSACGKTEGEPLHRTVAGDYITFGAYEQDNNTANGKEPIEWIVLDVDNEVNRALLLSRYGLDAHRFDASKYQGWDKSEIRGWLNSTFLNAAFTAEEQKAIATTTVKTGNNDEWATVVKKYGLSYDNVNGGADTQDKVFLLSLEEAMAYGGHSTLDDFASYITDKMKAVPTKYAVAQGAYQYDGSDSNFMLNGTGCCWWWLRSPGYFSISASFVDYFGILNDLSVDYTIGSVRPAFWLNLDFIIP